MLVCMLAYMHLWFLWLDHLNYNSAMEGTQSRVSNSNVPQSLIHTHKEKNVKQPSIKQPQECLICSEIVSKYTRKIFTCNHNNICTSCQNEYVESCLNQQNLPRCISENCPGTIKHEDPIAMNMLVVSLRDKLTQRILNKELKNNKKCPTPDCPGFINRGTCNLCLVVYCEQCFSPEHLGSCHVLRQELPEGVVRCPNCGEGIERDGGCLHMKCIRSVCQHQFCFVCLDKWSLKHHACGGGKSILEAIQNFFRELIA